ncbi:MAG TPA: hypothetical protein VHK68_06800, partial [Gemmatimonadales bacterium]|nr:hypothetical protein [Gemmatimonadales bacterium]
LASGRLNELDLVGRRGVRLANANAEAGRVIFLNQGKCNGCHGNAGALATFAPGNRNFNTGTERLANPARSVESFPFDGGFGLNFNGGGVPDSFGDGTFNTPPLIEAADTAPFFHNNTAATIEDAVAFYSSSTFNSSPAAGPIGGISLTAQENSDVADFLRVINAAFNMAIAIQRSDAAQSLESSTSSIDLFGPEEQRPIDESGTPPPSKKVTVDTLLSLANAELADAVEVLQDKNLHSTAVNQLLTAINQNEQARTETSTSIRRNLIQSARNNVASAKTALGSGLDFTLGEGNLVF